MARVGRADLNLVKDHAAGGEVEIVRAWRVEVARELAVVRRAVCCEQQAKGKTRSQADHAADAAWCVPYALDRTDARETAAFPKCTVANAWILSDPSDPCRRLAPLHQDRRSVDPIRGSA